LLVPVVNLVTLYVVAFTEWRVVPVVPAQVYLPPQR
jgi:hypothetical protein